MKDQYTGETSKAADRTKYRNKHSDTAISVKSGTSDIKAMFASADARFPIDPERRQRTLESLRKEIADKEIFLVSQKSKVWRNRMRYADRTMIGFHLLGCMIMLFFMVIMDVRRLDNETMIAYSMILSGLLGTLSVMQVGRTCFIKLAELSETCFFNVRQMAAYDMVLSGIIDLTALTAGILFAGFRWKIWLAQIGLYILVPFVFAQCVCLGVLLTEAGRKNGWLTAVAGIFLSVFYAILASTPTLYTLSALFVWGIALAAGSIIFGIQVRTLFTEINKGEILCTNWN